MSGDIRFHATERDGICTIQFDHPPSRNALDRATRVELVARLQAADADPAVRAIVLTGADPSFTSGVDAKQLLADPDYVAPSIDPPTALRALQTPTIAAVNGACVSGGLEIALACSFVLASSGAVFADTHAKLGLTPGWGLSVELPAAIGVRRARQMTLTGHPIDAETAERWGLVNELVPPHLLLARAREIGLATAELDPRSIANAVSLYRETQEAQLGAARDVERRRLTQWQVDRSAATRSFRQSVSPPST